MSWGEKELKGLGGIWKIFYPTLHHSNHPCPRVVLSLLSVTFDRELKVIFKTNSTRENRDDVSEESLKSETRQVRTPLTICRKELYLSSKDAKVAAKVCSKHKFDTIHLHQTPKVFLEQKQRFFWGLINCGKRSEVLLRITDRLTTNRTKTSVLTILFKPKKSLFWAYPIHLLSPILISAIKLANTYVGKGKRDIIQKLSCRIFIKKKWVMSPTPYPQKLLHVFNKTCNFVK